MTFKTLTLARNPFGVRDLPDPLGQAVIDFAGMTRLGGSPDDPNALAWNRSDGPPKETSINGAWSSRWNGGVDPTIPGDTKQAWKQGTARVEMIEERVYFLFDWDNGARQGLLEAQRQPGNELRGQYINLTNPAIVRSWVGLIIGQNRIDGMFSEGRLDFRR